MGCFVIPNLSKTCTASRLSQKNYGTKALSVSRWKSEIAIYVLNPVVGSIHSHGLRKWARTHPSLSSKRIKDRMQETAEIESIQGVHVFQLNCTKTNAIFEFDLG